MSKSNAYHSRLQRLAVPLRLLLIALAVITVTNVALVATGVVSLTQARSVVLLIELPLLGGGVAYLLIASRILSAGEGQAIWRVCGTLVASAVPGRIAAAVLHEARLLADLGRLLVGKRAGVSPSAVGFSYSAGTTRTASIFVVISLIELAVVHVLVPWGWLRLTLLVVSAYALILLLGIIAGRIVNPHLVSSETIEFRNGAHVVCFVQTANIERIALKRSFAPLSPEILPDERELRLATVDGLNFELRLREPIMASLLSPLVRSEKAAKVVTVRGYVDQPEEFVQLVASR